MIRYCGRVFTEQEIDGIRRIIEENPSCLRTPLSRLVCQALDWYKRDGGPKEMSCRVAMLRMERDGLIQLPPPQKGNGNGRSHPRLTPVSDPKEPITLPAGALGELDFRLVDRPQEKSLYNQLIERYHYLGYKPLPGSPDAVSGLLRTTPFSRPWLGCGGLEGSPS